MNQTFFPIMETRLFECCLEPPESPELTLVFVRLACDLSSAQQTQPLRTWCIRECLHIANSGSAWNHVHVCVYSRMCNLHRSPCQPVLTCTKHSSVVSVQPYEHSSSHTYASNPSPAWKVILLCWKQVIRSVQREIHRCGLGMVVYIFKPALRRQQRMYLCGVKASLVYIATSRQVKAKE